MTDNNKAADARRDEILVELSCGFADEAIFHHAADWILRLEREHEQRAEEVDDLDALLVHNRARIAELERELEESRRINVRHVENGRVASQCVESLKRENAELRKFAIAENKRLRGQT